MAQIRVELDGLDRINQKIAELYTKIKEVSCAADELFQETVSLEIKINQPSAGTGD